MHAGIGQRRGEVARLCCRGGTEQVADSYERQSRPDGKTSLQSFGAATGERVRETPDPPACPEMTEIPFRTPSGKKNATKQAVAGITIQQTKIIHETGPFKGMLIDGIGRRRESLPY